MKEDTRADLAAIVVITLVLLFVFALAWALVL